MKLLFYISIIEELMGNVSYSPEVVPRATTPQNMEETTCEVAEDDVSPLH